MIESITSRQELLLLVGQPVHVQATLTRLGTLPGRQDRHDYATALLENIVLSGVQAPITHAWVRLGETGSARARGYGPALSGAPVELDAVVCAYRGGEEQDLRLGLGDLSNFIAHLGGRWRTIARSREVVDTDKGERISQAYFDSMLSEMLRAEQAGLMRRLQERAQAGRVDRACHAMLNRYFARGEAVTSGQLRHAARVLGASS